MDNNLNLVVSGHQIETGVSLQSFTEEHMKDKLEKYKRLKVHSLHVVYSKTRNLFDVEINCELTERTFHVKDADQDVYKAFQKAEEKLSKRLRRLKRKIRENHRN